ncbi:MAG: hypothetical protein QOH31_3691 [Verrucomicrobiota bacterium]|jgi:hypothetical protein
MRWSHTTACGNDGKTKLISAGQSGAIELFTGPVVSAYEMLDERPRIWFGHIEICPNHRSRVSGPEWQPEIGRNFGLNRHYPCRATIPYRVCWTPTGYETKSVN